MASETTFICPRCKQPTRKSSWRYRHEGVEYCGACWRELLTSPVTWRLQDDDEHPVHYAIRDTGEEVRPDTILEWISKAT